MWVAVKSLLQMCGYRPDLEKISVDLVIQLAELLVQSEREKNFIIIIGIKAQCSKVVVSCAFILLKSKDSCWIGTEEYTTLVGE